MFDSTAPSLTGADGDTPSETQGCQRQRNSAELDGPLAGHFSAPKGVLLPGHVGAGQLVYTANGPREAWDLAQDDEHFTGVAYDLHKGKFVACRAWVVPSGLGSLCDLATDKGRFSLAPEALVGLRVAGAEGARSPVGSLRRGRRLFPCVVGPTSSGYAQVSTQDGVGSQELLHRMVARDVMGEAIDGLAVHHENERKLDSRPENLRVMSQGDHVRLHVERRRRANARRRRPEAAGDRPPAASVSAEASRLLSVGHRIRDAGFDVRTRLGPLSHGAAEDGPVLPLAEVMDRFGSVDAFVAALDRENHAVTGVSESRVAERFAIVASASTGLPPGAPVVIWPMGNVGVFGSGIAVYAL